MGLMIAIIASFVVWLATTDVLSSVLVALVIELVALTIETQIQLSHSTKVIADTLSISEVSATHKPLREVVAEYDLIMRNGSPLHIQEAQRGLLKFGEMIKDLRRGRISIPREEAYVRAGQIFDTVQKTVLATDIVMDPYKWSTGDHHLWQETNLRTARKGLKIIRIFILKDKDFLRDEFPLTNTIREQSEAGISVRYVTIDELEPELIRDGALLDDNIAITSLFTPAGEFGLFTLETSSSVVEDSRRHFERILARSHPFDRDVDSDNS
ncbi:MAG: hypothetical protein AM326_07130 [Candidatus Thorarchaeota archaeon SMTZ-45]|nr:MAG: hypothetical protein AM326_07130 [Candidatus Thorarchaeota archaeon SMTZ-45]